MVQTADKRGDDRELHKVPVLVQELNDIYIYSARMVNFNNKGVHLETDTSLKVGTDIIIGIEDSTHISPSASPDSPIFYHAKIIWQKNIIGSFFKFGYGTKFVFFKNGQTVPNTNSMLGQEYRKHARKPYSKPVIFTSMNQYYTGIISNISRAELL